MNTVTLSHDTPTTTITMAGRAARVSVAAGVSFVALFGLLHVIESEFDPTWRLLSEYQLGRYGWIMHLAFGCLALALAAAVIALKPHINSKPGYLGLGILALSSIGILLAAVFATDPVNTANTAMTAHGKMHVLGASLDWTPVAALILSLSLGRQRAWRAARRMLLATTAVTVVLMVTLMAMLPADGHFTPNVHAGLVGRLLLVSYLGWLSVVAHGVTALDNHQIRPAIERGTSR